MTSDDKTRIYMGSRFAPGVRLNDTYQLDELIASGGMGQVFRGHNIETEEPVAIKTILSELADDDTIFALFKKEGLILGRLNHPTIVRYYAFSRDPKIGRPYLVMEYVEGQSLAERMRLGPLPVQDVYQLFARVAEGLSVAHKAGVIHRDLSPDNIIIQHGSLAEPKVIDFGIAHAANTSTTLLGSSFAGKFSFVSPEQIGLAGSQVTNSSDIYSLGLVMVAALRGSPLNMGTMPAEVIERRRSVPDLGDIDAGIRPLVEQMLQPEAANRPESMAYIADWLARAGGLSTKSSRLDNEPTAPWMPAAGGQRFVPHVTPILPGRPAADAKAASTPVPAALPGNTPLRQRSRLPLVAGIAATLAALALAAYATGFLRFGEQSVRTEIASEDSGQSLAPAPLPPPEKEPVQEPPEAPPPADKDASTDTAAQEPSPQVPPEAPSPPASKTKTLVPEETKPAETTPADTQPEPDQKAAAASESQSTPEVAAPTPDTAPAPASVEPTSPPVSVEPAPPPISIEPATAPPIPETNPDESVAADNSRPASDEQQDESVALNTPQEATTPPPVAETTPPIDPEECYFAAVKTQSDDSMSVKGVGLSEVPFERIKSALADSGSGTASMDSHLITAQQCPATQFLKAIHDTTADNPDLSFTDPGRQRGDKVAGVLNNVGSRLLSVFMIDGNGQVFDLKTDTIATNSPPLFNLTIDTERPDFAAPGLIVAVASERQIDLGSVKTATDLPALAEQLVTRGDVSGIDFGFFSYGAALETVAQ